jgi:hypothetical protein
MRLHCRVNTERRFTMKTTTYIPALVAAISDSAEGRGNWADLRAASPTHAA